MRDFWLKSFPLLVLASFVLSATPAVAQSKCDAGKLKEYGKRVACLAKIDSKAAKKGEPADSEKAQKCADKFDDKCGKAESQGDCTAAVKSCAELSSEADACRASVSGPAGICLEDGDDTACQAVTTDPCLTCCNNDFNCQIECQDAQNAGCANGPQNTLCAQAANAAGCDDECCPCATATEACPGGDSDCCAGLTCQFGACAP